MRTQEEGGAPVTLARAEPVTAGAKLRAAREARGMHIGVLAATLKVPQAKLEALEQDRLGDLPDATFARALAKAVCRALKVDAKEILALLPAGNEPGLDRVSQGLNQPFRERSGGGESFSPASLFKPVVLGPVLVLLAALAVYLVPGDWLQAKWRGGSADAPVADGAVPGGEAASAPVPAGDAASQPAFNLGNAPLPAPAGSAAAVQPVSEPGPAPAVAETAVVRTPVAAASSQATVENPVAALEAGQVPLQLRFTADSWVEVVDAKGQVLLSKLMRSGEQTELQVRTPVKLRIGNVAGTALSLRGAPVDLAARARDNVARLELP